LVSAEDPWDHQVEADWLAREAQAADLAVEQAYLAQVGVPSALEQDHVVSGLGRWVLALAGHN
jgi:hypothetical protein